MNFLRSERFIRIWKRLTIVLTIVIAIVLVSLYFLIAPRFNPSLVNAILFHPIKLMEHDPALKVLSGVEVEEVSIPSGDANLNALFYRVPEAKDVILISHGNAANLDCRIDKVKAMIDCGLSVLIYDYRGYGKSGGEPSLQGIVDDGLAAYDFLINEKKYTPSNIVNYGESIGTGVSTEVARKRECKAIILESGFTSPEQRGKEKLPFLAIYPSFLLLDPALDNLDYVRGKHPPLLLFAGKNDETIPCHHSEKLFAEGTEPKQLVIGPNSTHNDFSKDFELYKKSLSDFLKANATVARRS